MMPAGWSKEANETTKRGAWDRFNAQRREDVEWMAWTGEHAYGAAQRLGLKYKTFETWAKEHAPEAWALLLARNPRDHNARNANQNQWTKGDVA